MKNLLPGLLLLLFCGCQLNDSEEVAPFSSYHWVKSPFSPDTPIFFTHYTLDENGNLYGYGYQHDVAVFKLNGISWTRFREIEEQGIVYSNGSSFAFYNGSFYLASFNKLLRLEEGVTKEIYTVPDGVIYDLRTFKGKLLIAGENLPLKGDAFSIVGYDGATFEPISKLEIIGRGLLLDNEMLFAGFPGFTYDGENVTMNNIYGYFAGADHSGNVYVIENELTNYKVIKKGTNGSTQIGHEIILEDDKDHLGGYLDMDGTQVLLGANTHTNHTITYVLNNTVWEMVEMTEPIIFRNFLKYNGRIIGCTEKGELLELVKSR